MQVWGPAVGRVVVINFMSIDGVIQSPLFADEDRDCGFDRGGWILPYSDDTVNAFMEDATLSATAMLLGRRSYEILRDAWSAADPSEPAVAAMNQMPKYVVASAAVDLAWENSRAVGGDFPQSIVELVARTDGELVVFGSGALVRGLAEHCLVDEYRLLQFPLILGNGKRMFDRQGQFAEFTLTDSIVSATGVVILTYRRNTELTH